MKDTYCLDSMRTGRYVSGARLIGQRLYRALTTPRGILRGSPEEEDFGDDLTDFVGAEGGPELEGKIRERIQRAVSKDETIQRADVDISASVDATGEWRHEVAISAVTAEGPFRLELAIGDVTVEHIGLVAE